jgi:hypothetical protein
MGPAVLTIALWAVHFTLIYGFTGLACARHMASAIPWVVSAASAAAVVALGAVALPAGIRALRTSQLPDFLAAGLGALAAIAVIWEASSLLGVAPCA